ncbi:MAG: AAA family ATPase [Lentisphaerae bacterium]|nr:AAA family ATPase [Lentisphaerota bacterium]
MIAKTRTGISFFDEYYGGVYSGRSMLVSGHAGAGKTVLSLQFVLQGIRQDERCLILSTKPTSDLILFAEGLEMPVSNAIESGYLIPLEYEDFIPGRDREDDIMLPPDGFLQLKEKIRIDAVKRVALNTVLPWVAVRNSDRIVEHVFSFVRAFDRMGVTSLFTMPRPVSALACRLKNAMEDVVPVSISLTSEPATGKKVMMVNKFLGENKLMTNREYVIVPKEGVREAAGFTPSLAPQQESHRVSAGSFSAILNSPEKRTTRLKSSPAAPSGDSSRIDQVKGFCMYTGYWNLREMPFQNVCDLRFVYLSEQHQEALWRLMYLVKNRSQGGVLTGDYGVGKSMILAALAAQFIEAGQSDYLSVTAVPGQATDLPRQILARMNCAQQNLDMTGMLEHIRKICENPNSGFKHTALIIDEAQMIRHIETYEFLHLLTNFQMTTGDNSPPQTAFTLILSGPPDFIRRLSQEAVLCQRLELIWRLEPLNETQTIEYIQHRVRQAGGDIWIFDEEAVQSIFAFSRGLPRLINTICDIALMVGFTAKAPRITKDLVAISINNMPAANIHSAPSLPNGK